MPKKAGKSGPPEVQNYSQVSLSHSIWRLAVLGETGGRACSGYSQNDPTWAQIRVGQRGHAKLEEINPKHAS